MTAHDGGEPPKPLEGLEQPNADYLGFDHQALVKMIENINPGQVGQAADLWINLGNHFAEFSGDLQGAVEATKSEWKGEAGDRARDYAGRLGSWFGDAGQAAQVGGTGVSAQSAMGSRTRHAMPEPVNFTMADAVGMMATSGPFEWPSVAGEIQQRFEEKQLRHQEAARIVEQYDRALYDAASRMPDFGRPPMMNSEGGEPPVPPPPPKPLPGDRDPVDPPPRTGDDDRADVRTSQLEQDEGKTSKQEVITTEKKPVIPPPPPQVKPPITPPITPPIVPPVGPPIGGPGRNTPGGGNAGRGGGGGGGGRGAGGPGGRGTGSGSGFGPRGSGAGAGAGAAAGGPGGGARGGFGPGAGPLGGPGGAGRGGAGGMPMGAGGRGEGGEDSEHKRPDYLIEPDPDEVFGTDEMTAPPVIGE